MVILFNFFSLGITEIAVVVIAIIVLIDPRNIRLIKPFVKRVYRSWLAYSEEVNEAEREMEEMKSTMLKPITDAEREVETELREQKKAMEAPRNKAAKNIGRQGPRKAAAGNKDAIINPIKEIRKELQEEKRPKASKKRGRK